MENGIPNKWNLKQSSLHLKSRFQAKISENLKIVKYPKWEHKRPLVEDLGFIHMGLCCPLLVLPNTHTGKQNTHINQSEQILKNNLLRCCNNYSYTHTHTRQHNQLHEKTWLDVERQISPDVVTGCSFQYLTLITTETIQMKDQ